MFSLAVYWFSLRQSVILQIVSSTRKVSKNQAARSEYQHRPQSTLHGHIELDTHADTTVLGSNCIVLSYTGNECEVSPSSSEYKAVRNVPVVTGAMVWMNPTDGTAYLLGFSRVPMDGQQVRPYIGQPQSAPGLWCQRPGQPF